VAAGRADVPKIAKFVRDTLKRPAYETDYITRYPTIMRPWRSPCVLGYLQVLFIEWRCLDGLYPLNPVGNISAVKVSHPSWRQKRNSRQCLAMIRGNAGLHLRH